MKIPASHECPHVETLRSRVVSGLRLAEISYASGLKLPTHSHSQAGFCLVLDGTYVESYAKKHLACRPQTITFSPAGERHTNHFSAIGSHCFTVEIEPQWLHRVRDYGLPLETPTDFQGGALLWVATRLYREFRHMDEASGLTIEGLTLELLAETCRHRTAGTRARRPPPWLGRVRELLTERFCENLSLTEVAEAAGVHPVYLSSKFRRSYGETVGDYVRRLKIQYACRQLASSDTELVKVALGAGFSSQSHFSRTFKRLTGITPAEYRKISRSA